MACPSILETILRENTLDRGRIISNENDEKLLQLLCDLITPSYVQTFGMGGPDPAGLVWVVEHPFAANPDRVIFQIQNELGQRLYPVSATITGNRIVIVWNKIRAGSVIVYGGDTTLNDPGAFPIGPPSTGIWCDGAADILDTDSIRDAINKINVALAAIHTPPTQLQGTLSLLGTFTSALISEGASQNLNVLAAGSLFTYVTTNPAIQIQTPLGPTNQFAHADKGFLYFYALGSQWDSFDLRPKPPYGSGTYFDENERNGNQSYPPAFGPNNLIRILAVGSHNGVPKFQVGSFTIQGLPDTAPGGWVSPGEVGQIFVRHENSTDPMFVWDTSEATFFYDDGPVPAVIGNPEIVQEALTGAGSRYLDGIKYYIVGDAFRVSGVSQDSFRRTYLLTPTLLQMSGYASRAINVVEVGAGLTKDADFFSYDFSGTLTNTWNLVAGPPVQNAGRLEFFQPAAANITFDLSSKSKLVRKSGWTIQAEFTIDPDSAGEPVGTGYETGIRLLGPTTGGLEIVYRLSNAGNHTVEVYETDSLASRSLLFTTAPLGAIVSTDMIRLEIRNTVDTDDYTFWYEVNPGGSPAPTQLGGTHTFTDWTPSYAREIAFALTATNQRESTPPSFAVSIDNFVLTNGRAKSLSLVPTIDDYHELLAFPMVLDQAGDYDIDARAGLTPQSIRGASFISLTASAQRLVNTKGIVSTDTAEEFYDNNYRQLSSSFSVYPFTPPGSITGAWNNAVSLLTLPGEAHVFDGKLTYPSINFDAGGYLPAQNPGLNYSTVVGAATYVRAWVPSSPKSSGVLRVEGVTVGNITAADIIIELMIPTLTDWLSLNTPYDIVTFTGAAGDGCRTAISSISGGVEISFTLGHFSTQLPASPTGGVMMMRITLPSGAAPEISRIEVVGW